MRKYLQITTALSVLLFLVWLRNAKLEDDVTIGIMPNQVSPTPGPVSLQPTIISTQKNQPTTVFTNPPAPPTATLAPSPVQTGIYRNGSFTGSVQDAYYGNVQVQVVVAGGKITDVIFLQYPNDNPTSRNINSQAMPILKQEALQAQSANVSGVSGASATSPAFQVSLASALTQAKN